MPFLTVGEFRVWSIVLLLREEETDFVRVRVFLSWAVSCFSSPIVLWIGLTFHTFFDTHTQTNENQNRRQPNPICQPWSCPFSATRIVKPRQ